MTIYAPNNPAARAKRAIVVVALLAIAVVVGPQALANDSSAPIVESDTYTVASGESLWSIASDISRPSDDVAETVETIQRLNMMDSSALRSGDQILIPALER